MALFSVSAPLLEANKWGLLRADLSPPAVALLLLAGAGYTFTVRLRFKLSFHPFNNVRNQFFLVLLLVRPALLLLALSQRRRLGRYFLGHHRLGSDGGIGVPPLFPPTLVTVVDVSEVALFGFEVDKALAATEQVDGVQPVLVSVPVRPARHRFSAPLADNGAVPLDDVFEQLLLGQRPLVRAGRLLFAVVVGLVNVHVQWVHLVGGQEVDAGVPRRRLAHHHL